MTFALLLALAASVCFAVGYVLQFQVAHDAPERLFLSPRLLIELLRHPMWVLGVVAMVVGNVLQATAEGSGSLAVIEPALTTSLLFALPLAAAWRRERMTARDWVGALLVSGGVALVLGVGTPSLGQSDMDPQAWALTVLSTSALALTCVSVGRRVHGTARAALIAAGASVFFGLQDALTRSTIAIFDTGWTPFLTAWQPYVLLGTSIYAMILMQSAYEAGPLTASLPIFNVGEPLIGILIGVFGLHEQLDISGLDLLWELVGGVAMVVGTVLLARSHLVTRPPPPRSVATPDAVDRTTS